MSNREIMQALLAGEQNRPTPFWLTAFAQMRNVVASGRRLGPHLLMDSGGMPDNVTRTAFDEFLALNRQILSA